MSKPEPKSVLSIDVGRRRIGLAGCDPLGITITKLPALQRNSLNQDLKILKHLCQQRKVQGLVVGLPLDERGSPTTQANHCQKYGQQVAIALGLPIAWVNEHSSSWAAGELHNLHSDRTGQLDSAAAALLLEQWLIEGPELKTIELNSYPRTHMDCDAGNEIES